MSLLRGLDNSDGSRCCPKGRAPLVQVMAWSGGPRTNVSARRRLQKLCLQSAVLSFGAQLPQPSLPPRSVRRPLGGGFR